MDGNSPLCSIGHLPLQVHCPKRKKKEGRERKRKKKEKSILSDYLSDILRLVDLAILGIENDVAKNVDFDSIINLFAAEKAQRVA